MASITREDIEAAVRAAWARDTCDPVDVDDWSAANPARGQCGTTALIINDLLGGELLMAEVLRTDGSRQGVHWWNRLPDETEIDLTREQFASHEVIQQPRVVPRPSGLPKRVAEQYLTLKRRVSACLEPDKPSSGNPQATTSQRHPELTATYPVTSDIRLARLGVPPPGQ